MGTLTNVTNVALLGMHSFHDFSSLVRYILFLSAQVIMSSQLTPDAAGLSVSVSPADVGRPGSLPQSSATPDLMNVSPLTEPAKSPSSSSALEEALKQREWLHSQKLQLTAQLNALESGIAFHNFVTNYRILCKLYLQIMGYFFMCQTSF